MKNKGETRAKRDIKPAAHSAVEALPPTAPCNSLEPDAPAIVESTVHFFETCLHDVFEQKREFLVREIYEKLSAGNLSAVGDTKHAEQAQDWIRIESLSRLRAEVGGSFQNIKAKWIDAGLPLREHRGDRLEVFEINKQGWITLSSWISNQGFETRLAAEKSDCLFEIRKR